MDPDPRDTSSTERPSRAGTAHRGRHAGKIAIVTGGARGIGAGIVTRLAAERAHVFFTYASAATDAEALVAGVEASGGRASAIAANSGDREEVRQLVDTVLDRNGRLDVVVSNAGGGTITRTTELSDAEIDRMIDVNIRGTIDLLRFSAPTMGSGGRIITIGSVSAHYLPDDASAAYGMTKGAVASLVRGLARELGPRGITVNNVQPGPVDTDANPADGPAGDTLRSLIPIGRFGTVAEVASFVAYVASDETDYLNGASLDLDGGYSA